MVRDKEMMQAGTRLCNTVRRRGGVGGEQKRRTPLLFSPPAWTWWRKHTLALSHGELQLFSFPQLSTGLVSILIDQFSFDLKVTLILDPLWLNNNKQDKKSSCMHYELKLQLASHLATSQQYNGAIDYSLCCYPVMCRVTHKNWKLLVEQFLG